ncbi:MAG: hypothetical protein HY341_01875 [Candidatus Kerfeldbacteria bacterium]|nr:hypothetical protein [Candidatus Kerfeldbacteria bacterium]
MRPVFVDVVPLIRLPRSLATFTYRAGGSNGDSLTVGSIVRIPFRAASIDGVVVGFRKSPQRGHDVQTIERVRSDAPAVDPARLAVIRWMSRSYLTSLATVATAMLPAIPRRTVRVSPHRTRAGFVPTVSARAVPLIRALLERARAGSKPVVLEFDVPDDILLFYVLLTAQAHRDDETVLLICPERERAEWLTHLLARRIGSAVACLHGGFSATEYARIWRSVARGDIRVLVTTRRSMLAPFPRLTTIVIDLEEDSAHKQWDQTPRFSVPEVADVLARSTGARMIRTCFTPRLETYDRVRRGRLRRIRRTSSLRKPPVRLIDLRRDAPPAATPHVSDTLRIALTDALARGRSAVILLNRRGYASRIVCLDCSAVPPCPSCRIPYHFDGRSLVCRICGRTEPIPSVCPACGSVRLKPRGVGIEALAEEIRQFLPADQIRWADADHPQHVRTLGPRILLTTEWILRQPTIRPDVAAVVDADALVRMPDYRARERALVTMRAFFTWARPAVEGLVQTSMPDEPVYHAVLGGRYDDAYDEELRDRRTFGYPPATTVILLIPPKTGTGTSADIRTVRGRIARAIGNSGTVQQIDTLRHPRYPQNHGALLLRIPDRRYGGTLQSQLMRIIPAAWVVDVDPLSW